MLNDKRRGFEICTGYESISKMPHRSTKMSAGYDFYLCEDIVIKPGEMVKTSTGIKAYMEPNEYLAIHLRSSIGMNYNLSIPNSTGIIDSDYYNNITNEGNIGLAFVNHGEKVVEFKAGTKVAQGIFCKYYITDDDNCTETRIGGFGSTGK